jgi:hypothetical protein
MIGGFACRLFHAIDRPPILGSMSSNFGWARDAVQ